MSDTKLCSKCKQSKSISSYYKRLDRPTGFSSACKDCLSIGKSRYYQENKEEIEKKKKAYYEAHREVAAAYHKEYYLTNKEKATAANAAYYASHKERYHKYRKSFIDKQLIENPVFRVLDSHRRRCRQFMKNGSVSKQSIELLGCSGEALRNWLSYQFEEGMNWNNYGMHGWHLDHVKPCASFNLEDPEEQKKCFHWTNLQPLWAKDNLIKGAKYEQL